MNLGVHVYVGGVPKGLHLVCERLVYFTVGEIFNKISGNCIYADKQNKILRVTMSHGDCYNSREHVQVPFALVIPEPLHFAGMNGNRFLVVMNMIGSQSGLSNVLQSLVVGALVVGSGEITSGECGCRRVQLG